MTGPVSVYSRSLTSSRVLGGSSSCGSVRPSSKGTQSELFFRLWREQTQCVSGKKKQLMYHVQPLNTVSTFTYYSNSSVSCAVTLFDHGVTTLVSPEAIFPEGPPYTLKKKHSFYLLKNKSKQNVTKIIEMLFHRVSLQCGY